jgi:biotin-dependent carboxylase-like uncharacterized protein
MTGSALIVVQQPPFATIQDAGRRGWMRWGVSGSGAMDIEALASANALVGNPWHEAAIEFALAGGEWEIQAQSCRIAVCGGPFRVLVDGKEKAPYTSLELRLGQRLRVSGTPDAVWGYIAVQGGFDLPVVLGSRSTLVRAGLGGLDGRSMAAGDRLKLRLDRIPHAPLLQIKPPARDRFTEIRVLLGPQDDHFDIGSVRNFLTEDWLVTNRIDRMGYHLSGPMLSHSEKGANIVSDGIVAGSIQVPASGQPIALMKDNQPTGGYPKIATILTSDIGRLAQVRPGAKLRFVEVSRAEASRVRRDFATRIAGIGRAAEPPRRHFTRRRGTIGDLFGHAAG